VKSVRERFIVPWAETMHTSDHRFAGMFSRDADSVWLGSAVGVVVSGLHSCGDRPTESGSVRSAIGVAHKRYLTFSHGG
jgi:hypothetical protein